MKPKIIISAFDFPPQTGGVAQYSMELAEFLHNNQYEVLVITKKRKTKVVRPFPIIEIPLVNSGILSLPLLAFKIRSITKEFKPDHIICTLWLPDAAAHFLNQKLQNSKIPYSIIVHGMEILESKTTIKKKLRSYFHFMKKVTFKNAQNCFCVSLFTKNKLLAMNLIDPQKVHVIHNGVNINKFQYQEGLKNPKELLILSACRLVANKGIDQMIRAFPKVIKKYPQAKYVVLGDGPDRERLQKLIHEHKMQEYIELKGYVTHETLNQYYNKAHLFVMLSRQENHYVEGFGLVFLEAALCKTPSLGGHSGGIPEAIEHEKTGWLVDPFDLTQIEEQLIRMLSDKDNLVRVGERAFQETHQFKTWDHQFSKMLGVINGK